MGVHDQPKVGYDILDFFALVERQSAVYPIGHSFSAQGFFKYAALGIGAVQDGKIRIGTTFGTPQFCYFVRNDFPFLGIAVGLADPDGFARFFFGEHFFVYLPFVLFYQAVGGTHDGLCGAVVLFQFEDFRVRIQFCEVQYIVNVGSPERIYALCVIPHHTHMPVLLGELQHDAVLGEIGVLVLVYQQVVELFLITRQRLRMVAEQQERIDQQIVEIHGICLFASLLVAEVDVPYGRHLGRTIACVDFRIVCIHVRQHQVVLGI